MMSDHADQYIKYYEDQAGKGLNVYRGANYQKGHGIGSFLGGLFRTVLPLLKSGAKAVGREALRTGAHVLGDIVEQRPVKESFKNRINEAGLNLKRKVDDKVRGMAGSGIKGGKRRRQAQSMTSSRPRRISRKNATSTGKPDIFT
jgi:hypothetical protein